jgi:hypothetical protein
MDGVLNTLSPMLHLTRITNAVAAVGNIWFVILWSRASPVETGAPRTIREAGLAGLLAAGVLVAVGMFAFAMALNDTLDLRRDRALHPERPLPSGRLSMESAIGLIAITLIAATLGSVVFGQQAVLMCLLTASAILFYDAAIKYIPSFGLVALGLIYAAHMLIPNVRLVFVWPVWVAMSHALLVGALTHRLAGRRPALTPPVVVLAIAGWVFWSGVLLWVGYQGAGGMWPVGVSMRGAAITAVFAILFLVIARQKARSTRSRRRAAEKIQRYGSLWLVLYATGWMLGEGYLRETLILGTLAGLGFLGMTTLREVYSLLEHPVGYRR